MPFYVENKRTFGRILFSFILTLKYKHTLRSIIYIFLIAVCFLTAHHTWAQEAQKPTRILFLVDGSSSMQDEWEGNDQGKFQAAQVLLNAIVDSIYAVNKNVEFGLRVFGANYHVSRSVCYDSRLEVTFSKQNIDQVKGRLHLIYPKGVSPIAYSLEKAALEDINDPSYAYSLILITDGGETCNGDICAVMQRILNFRINFKPYIISLENSAPLQEEYACMGKFMILERSSDMPPVISEIMRDNNYFKATESTKYVPETAVAPRSDTPAVVETLKIDTPKVVAVDTPKPPVITVVDTPKTIAPPPPTAPEPETVTSIQKINYGEFPRPRLRFVNTKAPTYPTVARLPLARIEVPEEPVVVQPTPPAPQLQSIERLAAIMPAQHWRMPSLYTIPVADKVKLARLPKIEVPSEPVTQTPPSPPVKVDEPPVITQIPSNDENQKGSVQVYFTNGKGTYYTTNPLIKITEKNTGKEVYSGVRGIVGKSEPETMEFPDGVYEVVAVKANRKAEFTIAKGQTTKVEIVVGRGSLSFRYPGSNESPKGYIAIVSQRFNPSFEAVDQPTETVLTYEASNYHIEINTLPPLILNLVIEFDNNYVADIPKEGIIQVTNEQELGRIDFYHVTGTGANRFYEMNIYGDPEYQNAKFLPGKYQVRYQITDPDTGARRNRGKEFNIRSNETLNLELD